MSWNVLVSGLRSWWGNAEMGSSSLAVLAGPFLRNTLELKPLSLKLICYQHTIRNKWSKKNNGDKNGQKEKEVWRQKAIMNYGREHSGSSPRCSGGRASEHRSGPPSEQCHTLSLVPLLILIDLLLGLGSLLSQMHSATVNGLGGGVLPLTLFVLLLLVLLVLGTP